MSDTMLKQPKLSIVIPTPTDTAALEETLVSVLENRPDDCEIIVALGCPYGDPWNIRDEVRFVQAPAGSTLVGCVNLGVASSVGDVVHILAAGWRATEGWTTGPLEHFQSSQTGAVVPLVVSANDHDSVVATGIRYGRGGRRVALQSPPSMAALSAASSTPHGPTLEAGFWRANLLSQAGPGFSKACGDGNADVDMAVAVASGRKKVVFDSTSRVVARTPKPEPREPAFQEGLHSERLFWRSLAGSSLLVSLVLHAVEIVRHTFAVGLLGTLPMLAGRFTALMQFGSYLPRYRQLHALRQQRATTAGDADHGSTIRMDGPHATAGRPRQQQPSVGLRRSA